MEKRLHQKRRRSPSAENVVNIEELLTEILVRVPVRPLLRFQCVSKHWHSIISNPKFCGKHTQQNPEPSISAVFPHNFNNFSSISFPLNQDSGSSSWNPLSVIAKEHGPVNIFNSCNGLFLCYPQPSYVTSATSGLSTFFVLNPTTNQFLKLNVPKAEPSSSYIRGCALAFDPSKSPHYKVVCVDTFDANSSGLHYKILIYSSETRAWKISDSFFEVNYCVGYSLGVYWNDAIHWRGGHGEISYYHIDEECVKFVKSIPHCYHNNCYDKQIDYLMVSSGGHLQFIDSYNSCFTKFHVLEMGKDYSGWFVKYNIDLDPLCISLPVLLRRRFCFLFLDDDEENEEDKLFLHTAGKVISCNLKSKTFTTYEVASPNNSYLVGNNNYLYKETLAFV